MRPATSRPSSAAARRSSSSRGSRQCPSRSASRQRVHDAGVQALRGARVGPERPREAVGGREADAVDLGRRVGVLAQQLDRLGPEGALDPRRRRGLDAVLGEEEPQRAAAAQLLPGARRPGRSATGPMPGTSRSAARGSRSTISRTSRAVASSAATPPPRARRAGPDESRFSSAASLDGPRLRTRVDLEAPAVLGVAAPRRRCASSSSPSWTWSSVPGERDVVALVGERRRRRRTRPRAPASARRRPRRAAQRAAGSAGRPASGSGTDMRDGRV